MKKKYFKALIPFASGTEIYNPSDENPGQAAAEHVESWAKVNYCEDLGFVEEVEEKEPDEYEAPSEPVEQQEDEDDQTPEEDEKEAENVENEPEISEFDKMKYPQLKKLAKEAGIEDYHKLKQADLIAALKGE